ncbi:MAG: N-acetyl-gamma-glutamyl-phosphate reductase [Spirochaetales bacterium]|nr:N-acetyl-gamma-glutamyl-phosphate reductase [Spirochaetales bacterium]
MKAAVLGISGYTGLILLRLLTDHPHVEDIIPVSSSQYGKRISELDPGIGETTTGKCISTHGGVINLNQAGELKPDVVFACLPHLKSAELCEPFFGKSVVIDLSADFRIKNPEVFLAAYGAPVPNPGLLPKAVYGLAEWYGSAIKTADIIANPGCYPTVSLLPLLPPAKEGLIQDTCIINAISGISGAGKKVKEYLLFCERTENTGAYSPGTSHRHAHEIQQELGIVKEDVRILFTPHLAPLKRGMVATITAPLVKKVNADDIRDMFYTYYGNCLFINLKKDIPTTRDVWGSNRCDIFWQVEGNILMLFSAIDNLIKGASGQAVQNMNLRFGFPENAGLAVYNQL